MTPIRLYLLHFANINKFYDTCINKKEELASRVPGCATLSNKFILNCLWWMMVIIEPFLSLVLITVFLPMFLFTVIVRKKKENVGKHLGLCYSGLSIQRIKTVGEVYDKVDYYLYPIFVPEIWIMPDKERHNVLEQISVLEVIKAYFWSVVAIFAATIKTHGKYLYRNYQCFEYVLTYYFFNKVSTHSTLYFVNHLDRWAILFNYAPQRNKVLLQHGIESPKADWPVKLTNVNKAYVFAESQKERMVNAVLGHLPEIVVMPPTITLTDMPSAKKINIVIIACDNYMLYNKEEYLIKNLVMDDLRIYVKIHPGKNDYQKYVNLQKTVNPNIEIIATPIFPHVDAAVSYYSTLGVEYEIRRIPVFYYDTMELDKIVDKIKELF